MRCVWLNLGSIIDRFCCDTEPWVLVPALGGGVSSLSKFDLPAESARTKPHTFHMRFYTVLR